MTSFIGISKFREDVDSGERFLETIVQTGDEIRNRMKSVALQKGLSGDIQIVGSTNPNRLTCIIDPLSPDQRYPCDFDMIFISSKDLDAGQKNDYLLSLYMNAVLKPHAHSSIPELQFELNSFPVNVTIANQSEINDKEWAPVHYSANQKPFSDTEKRTARELRLFAMRSGVYGGYTRGFKGIILEELARKYQTLECATKHVAEELSAKKSLFIPSPLDPEKNLAERLVPDIKQRTVHYAQKLLNDGTVKGAPYTFDAWRHDHEGAIVLTLSHPNSDPHASYRLGTDVLEHTLRPYTKGNPTHARLIIPHAGTNEVLIAAYGITGKKCVAKWQDEFVAEWDRRK